MEQDFLQITKKELFYTAVMLRLRQLVNIVYDFPADETKFERDFDEARSSLRKKKLLTESARNGISLDFALCVCAMFCSAPTECEVINSNNYSATIYLCGSVCMLIEQIQEDQLSVAWFVNRDKLDEYVNAKINVNKEV